MKRLSLSLLSDTVISRRKALKMKQIDLATKTGMNRSMLSKLETQNYTPSIEQLQALGEVLGFEPTDLFIDSQADNKSSKTNSTAASVLRPYRIAVAGTGYVGLSLAVLLSQHNDVTAVDIVPEKVEKLNRYESPIKDEYIEKFLREARKGTRKLTLKATTDVAAAYRDADFVIVAAPTNYDPKQNFFDCSAVEAVINLVLESTKDKAPQEKPTIIIKSTIPVGYTKHIREKLSADNIIFSPEFLRESKALYDNLYPSRIIVGYDEASERSWEKAHIFAALLQQGAYKANIETLFMGFTEA